MIPRYQAVLFIVMLVASIAMGVALWLLLDRAHQRLLSDQDSAPTQAPAVAPAEQATIFVASDGDGTMLAQAQLLPLAQDPGARAQAVLGKLLDLYAASDAEHPVPGGAGSISEVFLLPVQDPGSEGGAGQTSSGHLSPAGAGVQSKESKESQASGDELAVVNLTGAFVASHPSGIETETLTVMSICATLHANLPRVTQVRFLVDGQTRSTLAGHADLTRIYLAAEAAPTEGVH
jgi:hypothetical protein